MALPLDVRDLFKFASELTQSREEPISLSVLVEVDAPEGLLDAVRSVMRPRTAAATIDVGVIGIDATPPDAMVDAVLVLVGGGSSDVVEAIADARRFRIPVVALALREELGMLDYDIGQPLEDLLVGAEPVQLVEEGLAEWLVDAVARKDMTLANNLTFTRRATADRIVRATAWQNALIGGVTIFPGTDMPLMTANQAKMLLRTAAAYGQRLGADRLRELAVIVGGGFVFRAAARQALTLVPGFGWAVKSGIAFSGTMAMGKAAVAYFDEGFDLIEVAQSLVKRKGGGELAAEDAVPRELPEAEVVELEAAAGEG